MERNLGTSAISTGLLLCNTSEDLNRDARAGQHPPEEATPPYLLWVGNEVDGSVVAVIFLQQTEGELVVNQKAICGERRVLTDTLYRQQELGENTLHLGIKFTDNTSSPLKDMKIHTLSISSNNICYRRLNFL